jgi:hypothetical protein
VAVGQVTSGQAHRGVHRRVGDAHPVVELEGRHQPAQDGGGQSGLGLVDGDQLEAAAEAGVALDAPAVLGDRGGADAAQVAARQGRLQEICRVAAARLAPGADQHVDLVDEQDHAPAPRDLLEQALDALLQLAAVASAGQQAPHVERAHRVVGQVLGHVSGGDALGQSLDDGGLAHARLADQERVVLAPPAQHVDQLADLRLAPDDRVELAVAGQAGEIDRVLGQRSRLFRAGGWRGRQSAPQGGRVGAVLAHHIGQRRFGQQRVDDVDREHRPGAAPPGALAGRAQDRAEPVGQLDRLLGRRAARLPGEPTLHPLAQVGGGHPGAGQRGSQGGRRRLERGQQHVAGVDAAVPEPAGDPARSAEQLLDLVGGRRR